MCIRDRQTEEIRLICGQSVRIQYGKDEKTLTKIITKEDLQRILNNLIKFSYYAYEDDLAKGFVTIEGGHRVGICGKTVLKSDQPTLIKEISSMNIRFAKEIRGCASALIPIPVSYTHLDVYKRQGIRRQGNEKRNKRDCGYLPS